MGMVMLCAAMARVFGALSAFITTDITWLSLIFGGLLLCMTAFYIDSAAIVAYTTYQRKRRKSLMNNCRNGMLLCVVALLVILGHVIELI